MLDLMRLPLGILTGMGFIGGGAILRRDAGGALGAITFVKPTFRARDLSKLSTTSV